MKNIIQEIKDCHSARINCCACGAGERVYFIPESIISQVEVVVAKMETTTSTCEKSSQVGDSTCWQGEVQETPQRKGSVDMSEHDEIIAETREKYTVHNCGQCEFRKSCDLGANGFDTDECRKMRQSIMLGFGIEDGYFTKLLNRLEAAHKRDIENAIAATVKAAAKSASEVYEPHIQSEPSGNAAKK